MASLTLAATPGLLLDIGTITIQFTEPEEATDVRIAVFEADRWTIDGADVIEGQGAGDLRAEIFGTDPGSEVHADKHQHLRHHGRGCADPA